MHRLRNGILAIVLVALAFSPLLLSVALDDASQATMRSVAVLIGVLVACTLRSRSAPPPIDHDRIVDGALGRAYAAALTGIAVAILAIPRLLGIAIQDGDSLAWLALPPFAAACAANCYGMQGLRAFRLPLAGAVAAYPPIIDMMVGHGPAAVLVVGAVIGMGTVGGAALNSTDPADNGAGVHRSPVLGIVGAGVIAVMLLTI